MAKTITQLPDATVVNDGDELIIQQSGITKRATKLEVIAGIKNASIASDAAIAFSKLAALDSANILVGNASNVATKVAVTGDVTISNTGVTAIAAGAVVAADVADAAITPAKLAQPYTLATAQASTSGTSIDFTSIPSWVKRITVMLSGVSTNGTSFYRIQLGAGGSPTTSGYLVTSSSFGNGSLAASNSSGGFDIYTNVAAYATTGRAVFENISGNTWVGTFVGNYSNTVVATMLTAGSVSLSGTLNMVRVTTVNGTDAFDAGTVNISYEG